MKLLLFAHVPPPHHGQSYMVQLMLEGFGGDHRKIEKTGQRGGNGNNPFGIECYHVDSRLSQKLEDIGDFRIGKFLLLIGYCFKAIWYRFRYGVKNFYYIPAPGKRSALYRDWVVMLICRPFFERTILHWHAAGLAKWLETAVQIRSRSVTFGLMQRVDLSIVLSKYNRADAEKIFSRKIHVVSNGIPDPCPDFAGKILPRRRGRIRARRKLVSGETLTPSELLESGDDPNVVKILFLAHCTREKGLFDTVAGVVAAQKRLQESKSPLSLRLMIAGNFVTAEETREFEALMEDPAAARIIQYLGFVSGVRKNELLREADLFCFPTYYQNENQPVNLIEATAFGLPILTTRWRSIPELFPSNYPGLVDIRSPDQIAAKLLALALQESGEEFRHIFVRDFTIERHLAGLASAIHSAERTNSSTQSTQNQVAIPSTGPHLPCF
jgi:glycosyltransferase involved in cell wall biosynthesis